MGLRKKLKWLLELGSLMLGLGLMSVPIIANADTGTTGSTVWTSLDNANGATVTVPGPAPATTKAINLTDTIPLFDDTGAISPGRSLIKGSAWLTNQVLINLATGKTYYRISGTEYVDGSDITYTDGSKDTTTKDLTVNYDDHAQNTVKQLTFKVGTQQAAALLAELSKATPPTDVTGYRLDTTTPPTTTGDEVTFTYNPTVTFKFQDASGQQVADDEVVSGKPGDKYTVPDKATDAAFKGYTVKSIKGGTPSGTYQNTSQTFTYVYGKSTAPATGTETTPTSNQTAPVTVHYRLANGTSLARDDVIKGAIDATYQAKPKTIAGYTLVKTIGLQTGN